MKKLLFALALVVAAAGATVALVASTRGGSDAGVEARADPAHTPPATMRVLIVSRSMPAASTPATLHGRLEAGAMPHAEMRGKVMTDSQCTPDARGVSRCRNEVLLADGRTIVVRHPHDMSTVPCLSPGEDVVVRPA
jgi:hypothetical protein